MPWTASFGASTTSAAAAAGASLCPSFKVLFDRLDVDAVDGDVEKLPATDVKEVVDLCYQCKLCYNHCPSRLPTAGRWTSRG